jgi:peptidyl-prolyl cis-trans isomerase A (cyclophilin A)
VQFGIASNPNETEKWDSNIPDDHEIIQSNIRGTVSYATAGPGTRTTQLFINLVDNPRLDGMGFVPIGIITKDGGMDTVVPYIYGPSDDNGIDQGKYEEYGNVWLLKNYPEVDLIINTTLLLDEATTDVDVEPTDAGMTTGSIGRTSQQQQSHRFSHRNYDNHDQR